MDRRHFLRTVLAVSLVIVPTAGCLGIIARLIVGRGLGRSIGRAAIAGRTASALTFGRGVAIGGRLLPARASVLPNTQIVNRSGALIADSRNTGGDSTFYHKGAPVFYSRKTSYGYEHFDYNGPVGRSIYRNASDVRHEDPVGRILAIDRIRRAANAIDHLTADSELVGTTKYTQSSDTATIQADAPTVRDLDNRIRSLGLDCEESRAAYQDWVQARKECVSDGKCRQVSSLHSRYELLRDRCLAGF